MSVDAAGVTREGTTALHRLSSAANAPIFSYLDGFFDGSIVGGSMLKFEMANVITPDALPILGSTASNFNKSF
jgi:hypothetical protein